MSREKNENSYSITIQNKEIYDFYQEHDLDFESMNIAFLEILKKLYSDRDNSLNTSLATKILENISLLNSNFQSIQDKQRESINEISLKLNDSRKQYMEDIKLIMTSNSVEYISPLIKEANSALLDKTSLLIQENLPKNNESLSKLIESNHKLLHSHITTETTKLLSSSLDIKSIEDFLSKINQSMNQSQHTLTTLISSSENRIETKINDNERKMNEMKQLFTEKFTEHSSTQTTLQNNIAEVLKKFEKSSTKGNISEHIIQNILLSLYPSAQVDHVGNEQKETGDILLIRENKPKILIENKDHESKNVPKPDVDKFIRDCDFQDCCGIMLAQHRGIANKEHFEIQVHNGNILLYVHHVNFDTEKIKTAIDIVENFKVKLDEISQNEHEYSIEKDLLEEINREFALYATQRLNMIRTIKDFSDKMTLSLNELKMPSLEKYLSCHFALSSNQTENICPDCGTIVKKSIKQHLRYCNGKREKEEDTDSISVCVEIPPSPFLSNGTPPKIKRNKKI